MWLCSKLLRGIQEVDTLVVDMRDNEHIRINVRICCCYLSRRVLRGSNQCLENPQLILNSSEIGKQGIKLVVNSVEGISPAFMRPFLGMRCHWRAPRSRSRERIGLNIRLRHVVCRSLRTDAIL